MEHKLIDGVQVLLSAQEISQRQAETTAWNNGAFDRSIASLRSKRNSLLASSDWTVLTDSQLTTTEKTAWKTYRQALRDITENLTTVAQVNAVVFPDKP
jgi:hypothetical protein